MKILFPDSASLGQDIDYTQYEKLGEVVRYDFLSPEELLEKSEDADVIVVNKCKINENTIGQAKNLKLVCETGTGTDNFDKEYLASRNIAWRNVAAYSTESVAQHTFAIALYLLENLPFYDNYVKSGTYVGDGKFTHFANTFHDLSGCTWGILGLGAIGRRVADIAKFFGASVIYYSASGKAPQPGYRQVDFDTLLSQSDILSIHAPLNEYTRGIMDASALSRMKSSAILINTGRGLIVNESDLADALENGTIAAAGIDVLSKEPMAEDYPLRRITDSSRLLVTPHIGWASIESRSRLMEIVAGQIEEFFAVQD